MQRWRHADQAVIVSDLIGNPTGGMATVGVARNDNKVILAVTGLDADGQPHTVSIELRSVDATALGARLIESAPILRMDRGELP